MKSRFNRTALATLILLTLSWHVTGQKKTLNIGVVMVCPNNASVGFADRIVEEANVLMRSDYDILLTTDNILDSDCDVIQSSRHLQNLLNNPSIDLILGIDALSSHTLASNGPYTKPVIAVTIINAQVQQIPVTKKGTSGVKNLTFLELPFSPIRDLEVFQSMIGFQKLGLIADESIFTGIPEIKEFFDEGMNNLEIDHQFVFTQSTAAATLATLAPDVDAVYFLPSDNLPDQEYQRLIDGVNDKGLASFSILGRLDVDRGVLGGVAPASNIDLISRRIALNMQRIMSGEDPEDLNVQLQQPEELVINMATARKIDYSPNWETLSEAILINEERDDIERSLNIFSAIAEGLEQNLTIDIAKKDVAIVSEDVNIAKAVLLPDLSASASHTIVDSNTATISNGQNPENRGQGNVQLSQIIYSEQATANKQIQQYLLKAQGASLQAQSLDIVLDVSTAYLGLMQSKTAESIQRQNLDLTRKNLELARISSSLGQTGPSDLYRWQGEIATAKANLLNATAQRRQAELNLNQLLNRPIDELFLTQEIDINDSRLAINDETIDKLVNNPKQFYQFADFMVARAKDEAPDLKQFDYNLQAQERSLLFNQRNRYLPTFSVGGNYNYEFYRSGAGTEAPAGFGTPNDWNWNLQVAASVPIFQGGSRDAQVQQSQVQYDQLSTQKLNTQRLIEQQVRSELENIRASYTNIQLTKDAETASVQNFELIQDSYSKGVVTITQLLDAQNAAISAQLNSANAVYIFLIDLLNMERATGSYYMLMTNEQRLDFSNKLTEYFNR